MTDLINRTELLDHLNECLAESDGLTPITDAVLTAIKRAVEQMPTAEPTPTVSQFKRMAIQLGYEPVVRCKDCKWFYVSNTIICCEKHTGLALARADDFCSYGERRSDAEADTANA